jgi:hypothetical protein
MKQMLHKTLLGMILTGGLIIGMVKGEEVRQKWVAKMKSRHEGKEAASQANNGTPEEIMLDEYEISAYHS